LTNGFLFCIFEKTKAIREMKNLGKIET